MRYLKVSALMLVAVAFLASSALAGSSCSSSKAATKTVSSENACLSTVFAGASNSCNTSKAKLAELVDIEATRLPSGALVVLYQGKTPDAVSYLQASTEGAASEFCCPMTRKIAANGDAHVEVAKIDTGAVIVVTSKKKELVDELAQTYMTLASAQ